MLTIKKVCAEIKGTHEEEYHRGKSWEHCYGVFRNYKKFRHEERLLDSAAVHLGFFLASWGMLRGSSFLLQLDYKYYIPVLRVLIDQKYDNLYKVNCWDIEKQENNLNLLFLLKEELRQVMKERNSHNHKTPSDTLITKIIMATMGCVPAYDRYFVSGLKEFLQRNNKKRGANFGKKSFEKLLNFTREDSVLREIYKKTVPTIISGIKYPPMKILDLYFWRLGGGNSYPQRP